MIDRLKRFNGAVLTIALTALIVLAMALGVLYLLHQNGYVGK